MDPGHHSVPIASHLESARDAVRGLLEGFAERGTFGNSTEIAGGRDPRFTLRDFWRMYKSVPRLRKDMLAGLAYNWAKGAARKPEGHSLRHVPGGKYTFFHRSFCDLVVWEAIVASASAAGSVPPELRAGALASLEMALGNGRRVEFEGRALDVFSYYPSRDHLVPPAHPAYRHFLSWDAGVPDNDSTCIVLGSLLALLMDLGEPLERLRRPAAAMRDHLELLKAHVHGAGRYGQGYLSYACGATQADRGVLTWIFDEHNELDPTSNINVLNFLFLLAVTGHPQLEGDIATLCEGILAFLCNHARAGTLFHPRLQQYYPSASTFFFWHRAQRSRDRLDARLRARLDPLGAWDLINACMRRHARELFDNASPVPNPSDWALASPFLQREKILPSGAPALWGNPVSALQHFKSAQYEIFHLLYPTRVLCITESIPTAAYLLFVTELIRTN